MIRICDRLSMVTITRALSKSIRNGEMMKQHNCMSEWVCHPIFCLLLLGRLWAEYMSIWIGLRLND
jgi:hypothetical protein